VRSMILQKVATALLPVIALFAVYLLLRGHNEPGGGFIAGLVTASATVLVALAFGGEWARERLAPVVRPAFALGLLIAALSGMFAMLMGDPFLTHYHTYLPVPGVGPVHLSTTLAFDIGVFLLVVASAAVAISVFAEAPE
jgi:multisubunit Na+/H+ antiporter MnhB subunit